MSQIQEDQEIGTCTEHERAFECFCTECNILICPTCLMFDKHRGHSVCRIEDAVRDLRTKIDDAGKQGLLKAENSENILLDIRHTKLTCEEKKQKILSELERSFSSIMKALKQRKEQVYNEINEHFDNEFAEIYNQEQNWVQKQETAQDLVNLARSPNDFTIINNASLIINGINGLKQIQDYKRVQLINTLNTELSHDKGQITLEELIQSFGTFVQKGEIINMQYKC